MAPTASGLSLSKTHEIGRKLGEGEFGEVYAVKGSVDNVKWAVKVVPIPTKSTKKQNSPPEIAWGRLYHEYLVYTNCRKWSGSLLPRLPSRMNDKIDLYYENVGGFRCLVMEQLQGPLFDALDPLVRSASQFVELGKTASKLVDIVEAMHVLNYVVIDIKPENFMVASGLDEKVTDASLAANLRLIDLGLAKSFTGVGGHIANDGLKGLAGNALYASLNVHAMDTPSRRDDVQSVLFMIGEMILKIQAIDQGKAAPYGKGDRASYLPWSQEKSDEAVGDAKRRQVLNEDSEFFQQMPAEAAKTIFNCITEVTSYTFKQRPLYDQLREALSSLKVPRTSNRKPAPRSSKAAGSVKTPPPRRSPRKPNRSDPTLQNNDNVMEDEEETDTKRSAKSARLRPILGDNFAIHSLPLKSAPRVTNYGLTPKQTREKHRRRRVLLEIVAGSLKGNKYELIRGNREVIVIGSSPSGDGFLVTLDEEGVSANHIRFELSENQSSGTTVTAHDVGALYGIDVNGEIVIEDIISIADDSLFKLSDDAQVSVKFIQDE